MNVLTWVGSTGFIIKNGDSFHFSNKPDVLGGAVYDSIYYEPVTNNLRKVVDGKDYNLTEDEVTSINNFIVAFTIPVYNHYADSNGKYLGQGQFTGTIVPTSPPLDANYYWTGSWTKTNGVNAAGKFIGNAPVDDITLMTSSPEDEFQLWNFDTSAFDDVRSPDDFVATAKIAIDEKAGEVRTRYLTDVAGQAETYREKLLEAEAYAADPSPVLDSYIYIKAESLALGITGAAAAASILGTAAQWRVKGADIEGARKEGKNNQVSTSDVPTLKVALNSSIAKLDAM